MSHASEIQPLEVLSFLLNSIAVVIAATSWIPQIWLIISTGNYKGVSLGLILFGICRVYFQHASEYDYSIFSDLVNYGGLLGLILTVIYYWARDVLRNQQVVTEKSVSEKSTSLLKKLEIDYYNIVYVLLVAITLAFFVFLSGVLHANTLVVLILVINPLLRSGESYSQFLHIKHRRSVEGVSLTSVWLQLAAPIVGFIWDSLFHWSGKSRMLYFIGPESVGHAMDLGAVYEILPIINNLRILYLFLLFKEKDSALPEDMA